MNYLDIYNMVKYRFEFCYFEQEEVETAVVIKKF